MGSIGPFLTIEETARRLGVSVSQIHVLSRKLLLEAHYPHGLRRGKYFRVEDVDTLLDLRMQKKGNLTAQLPQLAMRAIVSAKRTEKRLEELMEYLGLHGETLGTSKEEVVGFFVQAEELVKKRPIKDDNTVMEWSKKLLAVTEEYLELVHTHTGEPEPWKVFMQAAAAISKRAESDRTRAYAEHARRNLRNVAYFFERGARGVRAANKLFPDEHYSGKLLQRLMPT